MQSEPDTGRLSRHATDPGKAPAPLLFSGGSALKGLSHALTRYTHNSIHLLTPFDSGGSSAALRRAFGMPSVGDLRSRLLALADATAVGHAAVYRLLDRRLPQQAQAAELMAELLALARGDHPLLSPIPGAIRQTLREHMVYFADAMPEGFDLRGASIGNLILCGGYLRHGRKLDPIVALFSKLAGVRGRARTICDADLHLGVELDSGEVVLGQHLITGKQEAPLASPIKRLFLSRSLDAVEPATARLDPGSEALIAQADLICYPPGSFYSSLLANLLPRGVGRAIAARDCVKVYIPNRGRDPEQIGMCPARQVEILLARLQADAGADIAPSRLLDTLLVDQGDRTWRDPGVAALLRSRGIDLIARVLVSERSAPYYDPGLLAKSLLTLA